MVQTKILLDSEENKLLLSLMIREIFKDLVLFESGFKGQIRFQIKGVAKEKKNSIFQILEMAYLKETRQASP